MVSIFKTWVKAIYRYVVSLKLVFIVGESYPQPILFSRSIVQQHIPSFHSSSYYFRPNAVILSILTVGWPWISYFVFDRKAPLNQRALSRVGCDFLRSRRRTPRMEANACQIWLRRGVSTVTGRKRCILELTPVSGGGEAFLSSQLTSHTKRPNARLLSGTPTSCPSLGQNTTNSDWSSFSVQSIDLTPYDDFFARTT